MKSPLIALFVLLAGASLGIPLLAPVASAPPLTEAIADEASTSPEAAQQPELVTAPEQLSGLSGQWHKVTAGETLRSLAESYYGNSRQWRTLQIANNAALHPQPGTQLWIPGLRDEMDGLGEVARSGR